MSKIVYIGVDGGGTKTVVCAADENHQFLCAGEGPGINYNVIGVKKAAENLSEIIRNLPLPKECKIAGIAVGDPSVDDLILSPMTEVFFSAVRANLKLDETCAIYSKSDVYMALYGVTRGAPGAILISGTGSMGMALDEVGEIHVSGGWGRLTEDEGSGYYIAVNGIKAALRYFDGRGPKTILLEKFKHYFGAENPREFIAKYYADSVALPDVAGFAAIVGEAASYDVQADKIIRACAQDLVSCMNALLKKAGLKACTIGIYGSVFLKNIQIRTIFTEEIRKRYPQAVIKIPEMKPEIAALEFLYDKENQKS